MSYKQLTYEQRYLINQLLKIGFNQSEIAENLDVHRSTVSRELKRNTGKRGYRYKQAHRKAEQRKDRNVRRITSEEWLIIERYLQKQFSPEQTSQWVLKCFGIQVSHEWIYLHIWEDKRNGGQLYKHLRRKKKNRRRGVNNDNRGKIPNQKLIEERPAIVEKRERVGDWEADTIIGKRMKGAIVTLVDRKTRFLRMGLVEQRTKEAVKETIIDLLSGYPVHTITFDNGKEFAAHEEIAQALNAETYFAHPYSSWERGTNENTNGLIRQYIPKETNFRTLTHSDVSFVEYRLNTIPRKCLSFIPPMVFLINHCCT
jgi:transposase, IS30 family